MKLRIDFSAMLLGFKVNEGKDGKKYYKVNIMVGDEVGSVSCKEQLYNDYQAGHLTKMSDVTLIGVLNMQYGSVMIHDIVEK